MKRFVKTKTVSVMVHYVDWSNLWETDHMLCWTPDVQVKVECVHNPLQWSLWPKLEDHKKWKNSLKCNFHAIFTLLSKNKWETVDDWLFICKVYISWHKGSLREPTLGYTSGSVYITVNSIYIDDKYFVVHSKAVQKFLFYGNLFNEAWWILQCRNRKVLLDRCLLQPAFRIILRMLVVVLKMTNH